MKIELKNIKYSSRFSQETSCFTASIWVDGKQAGTVENDGHGGPDFINPPALKQQIDAYAKTLPNEPKYDLPMSAEILIGDLLNEYLLFKDLSRMLNTKILYTMAGKPGIYSLKKVPAATMTAWLQDPALKDKIKADKILNLIPFAEAMDIFKKDLTAQG